MEHCATAKYTTLAFGCGPRGHNKVTRYKIYSHADADGAIAALLFREHLVREYGDSIAVEIEPVDYIPLGEDKQSWFETPLSLPCAVLDFALHPTLLLPRTCAGVSDHFKTIGLGCYWLDHHLSGGLVPFITPSNLAEHCPPDLTAIWDPKALSTPGLMRTHRSALKLRLDVLSEYEPLIDYSEIIDGALYQSAAHAHDFSSMAVKLAALFSCRHPALHVTRFYNQLIDHLTMHTPRDTHAALSALDADPIYAALLQHEQNQLQAKRVSYSRIAQLADGDRIALFDFRNSPSGWKGLGRFVPYELMPQCHYAIHVEPPDEQGWSVISCGENPWNRPPQPAELGSFFACRYNGGGHKHVAGGKIKQHDTKALDELVSFLSGK